MFYRVASHDVSACSIRLAVIVAVMGMGFFARRNVLDMLELAGPTWCLPSPAVALRYACGQRGRMVA